MMKVLVIVDHAVGISGPHRNVVGSLNALSARSDVDLRLLAGKIDENEPYASQCNIQLGFEPHNVAKFIQNQLLVRKAVKDRDLIYIPTGLKSFLYAYSAKGSRKLIGGPNITGIPIVMDPANPSPLMTMRMCDGWIEMSDLRADLCVKAGTPRDYINIIPHSIDTNRFSPKFRNREVWNKFGLDSNAVKLVYVGRMNEERKGIDTLINAFKLISEKISSKKVELILIGKAGPMLTLEHKNVPYVYTIGPHYGQELVELLASTDIFIAASSWETFWYTPLEAMACGLPVVVSNTGAVPLMIPEDGVQGRALTLVNEDNAFLPNASEYLADATIELIMNESLRDTMGKIARDYITVHFAEVKQGELLYQAFTRTLS